MSVLNDMLRNLESRGATADVPALAAAARPAAAGFALKPASTRSNRLWIWSATAFVVSGVVAGLVWQEQQARVTKEPRKPLGWSSYGAAISPNTQNEPGTSVAPAVTTVAMADPVPEMNNASAAGNTAAVAAAQAPVVVEHTAERTAERTAPVTSESAARAVPAPRPRAPRRDMSTAATETKPVLADDAASISITASASKDRNTAADLSRAGDLIARGRNSEAVPLLAQVLVREPGQAQARAALVALFAENGQRERALALLLDGAQHDPVRFAAPAAQLQAELGDVAGALGTLERVPAARRTPAHHALAGGLAHRNRQFDLAVDAYGRAVAAADAPGLWWVGLGLAHEALNQGAQARAAFVRANAHANLPVDVRSFVTARLQVIAVDTRRESATVAATAP